MDNELQSISMTIYPEDEWPTPVVWNLQAYVYGNWAAHELKEGDDRLRDKGLKWGVSHIPTGALAYVAKRQVDADKAAYRLSRLEPPNVSVIIEEGEEPRMKSPSEDWIRLSNERLKGLDIFACVGGRLIKTENVYQRYLAAQHMKRRIKDAVSSA